MGKKPAISLAVTTGLVEAIKAAGGSADEVLARVGLKSADLSQTEGSIAVPLFAQILDEAARVTADACFGLHFGESYDPKKIGPLIYVVLNSPTIGAGIENAARYLRIHNEAAKASLVIERDLACFKFSPNDLATNASRQHSEYAMTVAVNTARLMVGSQWAPREVHFTHHLEAATPEHIRVFRAPVLFGCSANAFVMERQFIERQVPAADSQLYSILKTYLEQMLSELPGEDELLSTIRQALAEAIRDGVPKLSRVAKQLAMSPRSLQRRLTEYGLDFKKLVDDTRRCLAIKQLKEHRDSLTEIAFMLGYSDLSAFNRAFKRWTGTAPLEYRRRSAGSRP
jgi:AraC-like DNA-binding protein